MVRSHPSSILPHSLPAYCRLSPLLAGSMSGCVLTAGHLDDLVSSPSQTETPLLHPPPSARPSPSPVSQTMTPRGGTRSSSLSSDSSFELPTPLRGRSQPIDIRPSPVRHGLDSTASSNSFRHHSDCDSAILLPRSPPQRVRLPPCPGCFTTAAHQSESEHQTGIHQHTSGLTSEKRQDCACGRSARLHPRSHHHHPPALKKQTGLPIQNHPANSDVSVLDLGPGFVDDTTTPVLLPWAGPNLPDTVT